MKQWYVFEVNGLTEDEVQDFLNQAFAEIKSSEKQSMGILHLTDKGVADLKKHVFKQEVTE